MYEDRVARGAQLLDKHEPGWWRQIVCDRLAMESCDECILGQLYGGYRYAYEILRRRLPSDFLFGAADHGFTLYPEEQQGSFINGVPSPIVLSKFAELADAWRAEIRQRLEAEEASRG